MLKHSQLQAILPAKDWESISCSSRNGAQSSSTVSYQHEVDEDMERLTPTVEKEETEELVPEIEGGQLDLANHIGEWDWFGCHTAHNMYMCNILDYVYCLTQIT